MAADGLIPVGGVAVDVVPDAEGWETRLRATLLKGADEIGREVGRKLSAAMSREVSKGVEKGVKDADTTAPAAREGADAGRAFGEGFARTAVPVIDRALNTVGDVNVDADTTRALRKIDVLDKRVSQVSGSVEVDADTAGALRKIDVVKSAVNGAGTVQVDADTRAALVQIEQVRRKVAQVTQTSGDIEIRVDWQRAMTQLSTLTDKKRELSGVSTVKVNADVAAAMRSMDLMKAKRDQVTGTATVSVDADTAAATAQLEALLALVRKIDGTTAKVNTDAESGMADAAAAGRRAEREAADRAAARRELLGLSAEANRSNTALMALTSAIAGLAPALAPLGAVAVGAFGAVATGAAGAAAGVGVLMLAIAPVAAAMKALSAADTQSAMEAQTAATARAAAARQVETAQRALVAAQRGVTDAERGVADARREATRSVEDAARAEQAAARAVVDARRGVADATDAAARRVEDALAAQARAEQSVVTAQRAARDAQLELNDARKKAADQLQELSARVEESALRQQQAEVTVARARERLAKTMADPKASTLDRRDAELDVEDALLGQKRVAEAAKQARAEQAEAAKAGVDGSDAARKALEKVADTQLRVKNAQIDAARAAQDVDRARVAGARQVADAQQRVSEAVAAAARAHQATADAQAEGARRVADAQRGVADAQTRVLDAQRALTDAQTSAATAGDRLTSSQNKVNQAMAKLSPAGVGLVYLLRDLSGEFTDMSKVAQQAMFPGFITAINTLRPALPAVTALVGRLAAVIGTLAADAAAALTGPQWTQILTVFGQALPGALDATARVAGNLLTGFASLMAGLAPVSAMFEEAFVSMSAAFADWAAQVVNTEGFRNFLQYITDNAPLVGELLAALGRFALNLVYAFAPVGPVVMQVVTAFAEFLAQVDPRVLAGVIGSIAAMAAAMVAIGAAAPVLNMILFAMSALELAATLLGVEVAALAVPFLTVIAVGAALAAAFVYLWTTNETFRAGVVSAWQVIQQTIAEAWGAIQPILMAVWAWVAQNLIPIFADLALQVGTAINTVVLPVLRALWAVIHDLVGPVVLWLLNKIVAPTFKSIGDEISGAYWKVIKPTLDLVFGAISRLGSTIQSVYNDFWHPYWDSIGGAVDSVWTKVLQPTLNALKSKVDAIGGWFKSAVEAVDKQWAKIQNILAKPAEMVINQVILPLGRKFNEIAGPLGVSIPLPSEFVIPKFSLTNLWTGGRVPGYSPHDAADNIPAMLTADEEVIRRASARRMRRLHPGMLEYINTHGTLPGYANGGRVWPGPIRAMSPNYSGHSGIDIRDPMGTPIFAAADGVVQYVGTGRGYGIAVFQSLPDGLAAVYGHTSRPLVAAGQRVTAGQTIAMSGNTGRSTGPHLHFEVNTGGRFALAGNRAGTLAWLNGADFHGSGSGFSLNPLDWLRGAASAATGWLFDKAGSLVDSITGSFGDGPFPKFLAAAGRSILEAAKQRLLGIAEGASADASDSDAVSAVAPAGSGAQRWAPMAAQVLAKAGLPASLLPLMLHRIDVESSGNPNAINRSDINWLRGDPSIGLMQVIGSTFRAYRDPSLPNNVRDPRANMTAAVNYTLARYGRAGFQRAWGGAKGYAEGGKVEQVASANVWDIGPEGGWLPPGLNIMYNGLGRPEPLRRADLEPAPRVPAREVTYNITAADSVGDVERRMRAREHEELVMAGLGGEM